MPPQVYATSAAKTSVSLDDELVGTSAKFPLKQLEHEMIMQHDTSSKDLEMVHFYPSPYNNALKKNQIYDIMILPFLPRLDSFV